MGNCFSGSRLVHGRALRLRLGSEPAQGGGGVAVGVLEDLLRCSGCHDRASLFAAIGAQVDHPISCANHVEVMLDDDDGMPRIDQAVQDPQQLLHVGRVKSCGRFVQYEQRGFAMGCLI